MRHHLSCLGYSMCCGLLLTVFGCASSSSGTPMLTSDNVKEIKKGVTTRQEIEARFGPPIMVSMVGSGKHVMQYSLSESDVHASPQAYIPIVNLFASKAEGQVINRSLQVNLDANDVVEDYQFNDSTNNVESSGNLFGGTSVKSTPVPSK